MPTKTLIKDGEKLRIVNPHTDKHYNTRGVIDTGADECSIPAKIANILGHNLKAGNVNIAGTAGGVS